MIRKNKKAFIGLTVAIVAILVVGGLTSCSSSVGLLDGLGGAESTTFTSNGMNFEYDTSASSRVLLIMCDPSGESELTIWGDKDSTGQISAVTSISGKAEDLSGFSALLANDTPYLIWLPGTEIEITNNGDGTYTMEIGPRVGAAARTATSEMTFAAELFDRARIVGDALFDDCVDRDCSPRVKRDLRILYDLLHVQRFLDHLFDTECIEAEEQFAGDCFELLTVVDLLGAAMNGIVADNMDLPADVRALCFNLSGNCDNGGAGGDGGGSTTPQVSISGASQVCAGEASTYSAQLSGTSTQVLYYWSIVTGSGNISTSSGQSTSVTSPTAGTVRLDVEARSTATGLEVATDSVTITVSSTGDCAGLPTTCEGVFAEIDELEDMISVEEYGTPEYNDLYCDWAEMMIHGLQLGCSTVSGGAAGTVEQRIAYWQSERERIGCD